MTDNNPPKQMGKDFVVIGGASGVGLELCALIYQSGGKVSPARRSEPKAQGRNRDRGNQKQSNDVS